MTTFQLQKNDENPSVDIVIPTLNCRKKLEYCLSCILKQDYQGRVKIYIIDGGSTDGTIEIARQHTEFVSVLPGMYMFGKNGARNLGETLGNSSLIWFIDSDNYFDKPNSLRKLVEPLKIFPSVNISVPLPNYKLIEEVFSLNNWLSYVDANNLRAVYHQSESINGNVAIVPDLDYGIPNGCLVRRKAVLAAGGTDTDTRLLRRMNLLGLSKAAIVADVIFYHEQCENFFDFIKKWVNRIKFYATKSEVELEEYFIEFEYGPKNGGNFIMTALRPFIISPLLSIGSHRQIELFLIGLMLYISGWVVIATGFLPHLLIVAKRYLRKNIRKKH